MHGASFTGFRKNTLADVPPQEQWFSGLKSAQTQRAYRNDVRAFMAFMQIAQNEDWLKVVQSHGLAWRSHLETQKLATATIRRKLAALTTLFDEFCAVNAAIHNPFQSIERPPTRACESQTRTLTDAQARALLTSPPGDTLKGKRDRAILSVLLFHALRQEELTQLRVKDFGPERNGIPHLCVHGKGRVRELPINAHTLRAVDLYLNASGHGQQPGGPLFRRIRAPKPGCPVNAMSPTSIYSEVVVPCMRKIGINAENMGPHALRATAATNALTNQADIVKVQEWMGHANIGTTRTYDPRAADSNDSPTFRVVY